MRLHWALKGHTNSYTKRQWIILEPGMKRQMALKLQIAIRGWKSRTGWKNRHTIHHWLEIIPQIISFNHVQSYCVTPKISDVGNSTSFKPSKRSEGLHEEGGFCIEERDFQSEIVNCLDVVSSWVQRFCFKFSILRKF